MARPTTTSDAFDWPTKPLRSNAARTSLHGKNNSARCHALRQKHATACALDRGAAGTPTTKPNRYCVTLNRKINMAKSNAQRQSDYRARHLKDIDGNAQRLNLLLDLHAKRALERLAACYAVTQREVLERLLRDAESAAIDRAVRVPDGQTDYYERRLRLAHETVTQ